MSGAPVLRTYGPRAVLIELPDLEAVMRTAATLRAEPPDGVIDVVPAARTVLVTFEHLDLPGLMAQLGRAHAMAEAAVHTVELPVVYDGPDLPEVAARCDTTVDDVIARHAGGAYTVAFCGFKPGFSYLVGLDPVLHVARRADPRPLVRAGSVAIAAEYSAVYPSNSPGGWHVIGHTDAVLWDETRAMPALLPPGTRVRFVPR